MMSVQPSIEERVRRLLAIAEDPAASPAERELAMNRATILMARHSITSLSERTVTSETIETRKIRIPGGNMTASLALSQGIHAMAQAAGCSSYYYDYRKRTRPEGGPEILVYLVGFPSDLNWVTPLASVLIAYALQGWKQWCRDNPRRYKPMKPATRSKVRNGYVQAFSSGVARRIRETRSSTIADEERTSGTNTTALVVRDRTARVEEFLATLNLSLGVELNVDERARYDAFNDGYHSGLGDRRGRLADSPSIQRITT